jgi:hypothetical protein
MIRMVGTTSNLAFSRLIRWGLGTDTTHVALIIDEFDMVYHSNIFGTHLELKRKFFKQNKITCQVELPIAPDMEYEFIKLFTNSINPWAYDWWGLSYFAWRGLLRKLFRIPLPKRNKWQLNNCLLCVEVGYMIAWAYKAVTGKKIIGDKVDLSMTAPKDLINLVKENLKCSK